MIIAGFILIPTIAGLSAIFWRSRGGRRGLLVVVALAHAALTATAWALPQEPSPHGWLGLDSLGLTFLSIISVLFLASATYGVGYLRDEERKGHIADLEEGFLFTNAPEATFIGCLLLFLAAMTLVTTCQHLGLLWVGVEATTLASAPLIYFHRQHRSLEATWKYIMICSVGIALALLGNFLLAVAARGAGEGHAGLVVGDLIGHASGMNTQWLKAAFLFFLVGYLPTLSYCGRIRGDFLNTTAVLCGNRFGRALVRPGGLKFDADESRVKDLAGRVELSLRAVEGAANLLWNSASVMARFEDTGHVPRKWARDLGLVGMAARACGVEVDVRHDFPTGIYRFALIPMAFVDSGDAFARAFVRWQEIQRSGNFILEQLRSLPGGPISLEIGPLQPNALAVSLVEGWRGEICHVAITDDEGRFAHYKVIDPSFHN